MTEQAAEKLDHQWVVDDAEVAGVDPLLECLQLLTRLHGRPLSRDALVHGLPLEDGILTPSLFPRAARRAGLAARLVRRNLDAISPLVLPAVLLLDGREACVLVGLDREAGEARVLFPESGEGEQRLPLPELAARYSGIAIFAQPEHRFDARTPATGSDRSRHWFWGVLGQSWRIYRDVLAASLLINLFALASPLFVMNVYDRVVPNQAHETLWVLAIGVAVVVLFDLLMRMLRGYFIDIAGKKADVLLSARIFEQVLGLRMEGRPASVGAFANNLRAFESVRDFITSATITAVIDLPFVVLFLAVIAFVGGPLVFVPLAAIPLLLGFALLIRRPLQEAVQAAHRASAQKNATLIESLTAAETIKSLGAESPTQRKWEKAVGFIARTGLRSRLLSASVVNLAVFMQQLTMVAIVVYGVYLIGEGDISMGGLIAAVMLTGRAMAPMAQVANLATQYHQTKTALESLEQIMSLPVERPAGKQFVSRPRLQGAVEFRDLSFRYPGEEQYALRNVNLRIEPGERVGIIGRIGSGKTTLEKLILGLYEPTEGAVHIDGVDVRQIDPADIRRNIGYVPQDVMLFYGTVRENITFGVPHADDAEILEAARLSGVDEFVNRHPLGFDMPVGERGEGLSGGQRQAVVIARAWLRHPSLLIMDEPTNSMDNSSEERFKAQLAQRLGHETLILVTHRASLLDLVDRVIVMDQGRVAADGPKDQVLEALRQGRIRGLRR